MSEKPTVHIVDDDEAVRDSLSKLMNSANLNSKTYGSAEKFLELYQPARLECLLLDIRMAGMNGMDLQRTLPKYNINLPIIMMTGYSETAIAVSAMKAGAVDFIEKPFNHEDIINRVVQCIHEAENREKRQQVLRESQKDVDRLLLLSPRERKVFELLAEGKINKTIAKELGISTRTVEAHRAKIMEKLDIKSPVEIARIGIAAKNQSLIE